MALNQKELQQIAGLIGEALAPKIRDAVAENVSVRMAALEQRFRDEQKATLDGLELATAKMVETAAKAIRTDVEKLALEIKEVSTASILACTKNTEEQVATLSESVNSRIEAISEGQESASKNLLDLIAREGDRFHRAVEATRAAIPALPEPPIIPAPTKLLDGKELSAEMREAMAVAVDQVLQPMVDAALQPLRDEIEDAGAAARKEIAAIAKSVPVLPAPVDLAPVHAAVESVRANIEEKLVALGGSTRVAITAHVSELKASIEAVAKSVPVLPAPVDLAPVHVAIAAMQQATETQLAKVAETANDNLLDKVAEIKKELEAVFDSIPVVPAPIDLAPVHAAVEAVRTSVEEKLLELANSVDKGIITHVTELEASIEAVAKSVPVLPAPVDLAPVHVAIAAVQQATETQLVKFAETANDNLLDKVAEIKKELEAVFDSIPVVPAPVDLAPVHEAIATVQSLAQDNLNKTREEFKALVDSSSNALSVEVEARQKIAKLLHESLDGVKTAIDAIVARVDAVATDTQQVRADAELLVKQAVETVNGQFCEANAKMTDARRVQIEAVLSNIDNVRELLGAVTARVDAVATDTQRVRADAESTVKSAVEHINDQLLRSTDAINEERQTQIEAMLSSIHNVRENLASVTARIDAMPKDVVLVAEQVTALAKHVDDVSKQLSESIDAGMDATAETASAQLREAIERQATRTTAVDKRVADLIDEVTDKFAKTVLHLDEKFEGAVSAAAKAQAEAAEAIDKARGEASALVKTSTLVVTQSVDERFNTLEGAVKAVAEKLAVELGKTADSVSKLQAEVVKPEQLEAAIDDTVISISESIKQLEAEVLAIDGLAKAANLVAAEATNDIEAVKLTVHNHGKEVLVAVEEQNSRLHVRIDSAIAAAKLVDEKVEGLFREAVETAEAHTAETFKGIDKSLTAIREGAEHAALDAASAIETANDVIAIAAKAEERSAALLREAEQSIKLQIERNYEATVERFTDVSDNIRNANENALALAKDAYEKAETLFETGAEEVTLLIDETAKAARAHAAQLVEQVAQRIVPSSEVLAVAKEMVDAAVAPVIDVGKAALASVDDIKTNCETRFTEIAHTIESVRTEMTNALDATNNATSRAIVSADEQHRKALTESNEQHGRALAASAKAIAGRIDEVVESIPKADDFIAPAKVLIEAAVQPLMQVVDGIKQTVAEHKANTTANFDALTEMVASVPKADDFVAPVKVLIGAAVQPLAEAIEGIQKTVADHKAGVVHEFEQLADKTTAQVKEVAETNFAAYQTLRNVNITHEAALVSIREANDEQLKQQMHEVGQLINGCTAEAQKSFDGLSESLAQLREFAASIKTGAEAGVTGTRQEIDGVVKTADVLRDRIDEVAESIIQRVEKLAVEIVAAQTATGDVRKNVEEVLKSARTEINEQIGAVSVGLYSDVLKNEKALREEFTLLATKHDAGLKELSGATAQLADSIKSVNDALPAMVADAAAAIEGPMTFAAAAAAEQVAVRVYEDSDSARIERLEAVARTAAVGAVPAVVAAQTEGLPASLAEALGPLAVREATRVATDIAKAASEAAIALGKASKAEAIAEATAEAAMVARVTADGLREPLLATLDPTERIAQAIAVALPPQVREAMREHAQEIEPRIFLGLASKLQVEIDRIPRPRDGEDGEDGEDGKDARVIAPVPYEVGKRYEAGVWVAHTHGVWVAARNTADEPTSDSPDWDCVSPGVKAVEAVLADDGRTVELHVELSNGAFFKNEFKMPVPIDRGVFVEGREYEKGDLCTFDGSMWSAQRSGALSRPGSPNSGWRLTVKHGKDGKDLKQPKPLVLRNRKEWTFGMVCEPNDVVSYAGVNWLCTEQTREQPPHHSANTDGIWIRLGSSDAYPGAR